MEKVFGKIQQVTNGQTKNGADNYNLVLEGSNLKYYGFGHVALNMGEEVQIEYVMNANFRNIQKVTRASELSESERVTTPPPSSPQQPAQSQGVDPSVWVKKDRMIARESVLRTAAMVLATIGSEKVEELAKAKGLRVLTEEIAAGFEEWVYREDDTESPSDENPQ